MRAMSPLSRWLSDSWDDFARRWTDLMLVTAVGGIAAAAAAVVPLVPALLLALARVASPWAIWGPALFLALLAALWVSTWGQAALMRAAARDEKAFETLRVSWSTTGRFAWVTTLFLVAVGGAFVLFIVPGLFLAAALMPGLFYELDGEAEGLDSLSLAWGRFRAAPLEVLWRTALAFVLAALPSLVPWIGWLLGPLAAPFALVAAARLAAELKTLTPAPEKPRLLGPAIFFFSGMLVLSSAASAWIMYNAFFAARELIASGQFGPDEARRALEWALSQSSSSETYKALLPPGTFSR